MTNPMRQGRETPGLPTPPKGWPIGSYGTYAEAQHAVDYLADQEFTVQDVTIVGVDLMQVERVIGRLTWGKVVGGGIVSGAWLGLFFGFLVTLVVSGAGLAPLLFGLVGGIVFGLISATIPYAATRGQRDFASTMQLVAGRYDVLCDPRSAEKARDMLSRLTS
ncbi:general stress protein [Gordonia sp. DT218]|uniref:general stress protein n=1 Tax=Gordonia sp. DT218 TaxID=3416659 RepID=UPI003CE72D29